MGIGIASMFKSSQLVVYVSVCACVRACVRAWVCVYHIIILNSSYKWGCRAHANG